MNSQDSVPHSYHKMGGTVAPILILRQQLGYFHPIPSPIAQLETAIVITQILLYLDVFLRALNIFLLMVSTV